LRNSLCYRGRLKRGFKKPKISAERMDTTTQAGALSESTVDNIEVSHRQGIREVVILAISLSILQAGFGIVTPIFPFYIILLGVGGVELGVLAASFALTRILLAGPLGRFSDRIGRKPVLVFGLMGFAVANVVYAWAGNVIIMIAARAVEGAVSAGFFPAANAYVSDVTIPENRGTAMGYLSMGNMVGFVIGPTLGGILAEFLGFRLPFIVAGYATIAALLAVIWFVHEPKSDDIKRGKDIVETKVVPVREVLSNHPREYLVLAMAMFANMFAIGVLEVAFMLDAVTRYSISPFEIGVFFGVFGIITIIGNVLFGKISDKYGRKWLIVFGSVVGGISLLLFVQTRDITGFYIAGAVLGIAIAMRGPTIQALIADLTDRRSYGIIMGLFGAVSNGAYVIGPIMGGTLFDISGSGESSLSIAAAFTFIIALATAIGLPGDSGKNKEEEKSQLL